MQFDRRIKSSDSGELPTDLHLFLKPKDPKSIILGNTFSNQRLYWLACEDKLAFINNSNNDIWVKVDLSDFFSEPCVITCGEEITLQNTNSTVLLLGCETSLGGLILFFQPFLRRIIRVVEIDVGVSSICVVANGDKKNPLLPGVLSYMDGIVALGGVDGSLIFVDMWYSVLAKAAKGEVCWNRSNWAWPSVVNKIQYINRQTDTLESIKCKIDRCLETEDSLAYLLNDNEGELIAPRHGQVFSSVTCLHYCPIAATIFIGYEVGIWQMWSISELELMYTSNWNSGQGVSVVGLSVMEPSDDPRHYLYLWVGHSRAVKPACVYRNSLQIANSPPNSPGPMMYPPLPPASQEPPFSLIYSLAFYNKGNIDSYGLLYSDFYKCDDIYEMEMVKELDNFISGRIITIDSLICDNPLHKYDSNRDEEKELLRVWSIVWECEFEELDDKMVYVTLFDLNQWYNKIPGRPEVTRPASSILPLPDTPYFATWYLPPYNQNDKTLALRVDPTSLASSRFSNQLDVHYYPSNISYKCTKVGSMRICQGEGLSVLSEIKSRLELQPAVSMSVPETLMHACISIGLLPNFDDAASIQSITINADIARRYLLTICIENGLRDVILSCARYWFDNACTDTSISLDFLVDSLWDLFNTYQNKIDELCICLFDCSGTEFNSLSNIRIRQISEYMKIIKSIYSILIKDYSTFKKIYIVKHRHMAIEIKTFYVDLVIWCISHNILPAQSSDIIPETSIPYKEKLMRNQVAARRVNGHLLIDEMIKRWISKEVEDWGCDIPTAYPPSSVQSIIHLALIAHISPSVKHFFILYFLQDLLDCLSSEKYFLDTKKIMENYESYFGLREGLMRIIISYRDIDRKQYKDAVERLLDKSVKISDIEEWEHRHIITELYKHKEYNLAYSYIKGMKPPLGTIDDIKMEISLNVALNNMSTGFFLTQKRNKRYPILLKHFFQECVNMKKLKHVYLLPLDKFEENCFLEFLSSSKLNMANDLILYYYINRHRYAEAFVHYERMKRSGDVGSQDSESRKRDMIMKTLESRFDPKLLLLQRSVWEAKNTSPPNGFFEEKWKPTSSYLKFDDTNPKKPLLKSSIKELAYITVWQGQKLSKMKEKAYSIMKSREDDYKEMPLIENVQTLKRNFNQDLLNQKKRLRSEIEIESIKKKAKFGDLSLMAKEVLSSEPKSPKETLDYSIVQDMISTPKILQNKSPYRHLTTPGPASILRIKSAKKEDISSCDESSSTPRKTLKFSLPTNSDKNEDKISSIGSRILELEEVSDDDVSFESLGEEKKSEDNEMKTLVSLEPVQFYEKGVINEEESLDDELSYEDKVTDKDISEAKNSNETQTADKEILLEDRLELMKSRNPKFKSLVENILTSEHVVEITDKEVNVHTSVECTSVSNESSDADDRSKCIHLEDTQTKHTAVMENEWQMENNSVHTLSQSNYDIDNNSSASDSMDKVYTTIGAPVQKLSTVFEVECENEEPCHIGTENISAETAQHKDNYNVSDKNNYQDSEIGDGKLDQECDFMQFDHEDNFSKQYDYESESNHDNDEIAKISQGGMVERKDTFTGEQDNSDDEDAVICLDSDSEDEPCSKAPITNDMGEYAFSDSERGESLSRSSFTKSQDYSGEEYDDHYEEESYEGDDHGEGEMFEEEEECQESAVEEVSDDSRSYQGSDSNHADSDDTELSVGGHQQVPHVNHSSDFITLDQCITDDETKKVVTTSRSKSKNQENTESEISTSLAQSTTSHLDPSLLEKIVSFSRTVSEEQLKGLVNAVKTSINTSKVDIPEINKAEPNSKPKNNSVSLSEESGKKVSPDDSTSKYNKSSVPEILEDSKLKEKMPCLIRENCENASSSIIIPSTSDLTSGKQSNSENKKISTDDKLLNRFTPGSKEDPKSFISNTEKQVQMETGNEIIIKLNSEKGRTGCEIRMELDSVDDRDPKKIVRGSNVDEISSSDKNHRLTHVGENVDALPETYLSGGQNISDEKQDILDAVKLLPAPANVVQKIDQPQTPSNHTIQEVDLQSEVAQNVDLNGSHIIKKPEEFPPLIKDISYNETSTSKDVETFSKKHSSETSETNSIHNLNYSSDRPKTGEGLSGKIPTNTFVDNSLSNQDQLSTLEHKTSETVGTLLDKSHLFSNKEQSSNSSMKSKDSDNLFFPNLQDPEISEDKTSLEVSSKSCVKCFTNEKEEGSTVLSIEETSALIKIKSSKNSDKEIVSIKECQIISQDNEEIVSSSNEPFIESSDDFESVSCNKTNKMLISNEKSPVSSEYIISTTDIKVDNKDDSENNVSDVKSKELILRDEKIIEDVEITSFIKTDDIKLQNTSIMDIKSGENDVNVDSSMIEDKRTEISDVSAQMVVQSSIPQEIFGNSTNEGIITVVKGKSSCELEIMDVSIEPTAKNKFCNEESPHGDKMLLKCFTKSSDHGLIESVCEVGSVITSVDSPVIADNIDSFEIGKSHSLHDSEDLNTAILIENESYDELNNPHSMKIAHSELSADDDNVLYLDSNISVAFEVNKSGKKKKSNKKVEMVDKCIMTDKRKLRKKPSISKEDELTIKELKKKQNVNLVDRSMMTEKSVSVDLNEAHNVTPRRSRRRSSSLQPDTIVSEGISKSHSTDALKTSSDKSKNSLNVDQFARDLQDQKKGLPDSAKPNRVIRKALRRTLKSAYSENDITAMKSSYPVDHKEELRCSAESLNNEAPNHCMKSENALAEKDKVQRKIRKAVRRINTSANETNVQLEIIPEHKALVLDNPDTCNNTKHTSHSRSSSVPNISALDDNYRFDYINTKLTRSSLNNLTSKYSSNEELSTLSADTEHTPRRSRRLIKPVDYSISPSSSNTSINSLSEPSDKQIIVSRGRKSNTSESSNHSVSLSRNVRRSRPSRRSTLADIIELPESDLEKSTGPTTPATTHVQSNRRRRPEGIVNWESDTKVDLSQLAMKEAKKTSRRRTMSSSSESQFTYSESESNVGDAPAHWLRSSSKSDISEPIAESTNTKSVRTNSHQPMGTELLKVQLRRRRSRSKDIFIKGRRSYNLENIQTNESDIHAPSFEPHVRDSSPELPQIQVTDYSNSRRLTRHQRSLTDKPSDSKQNTPEPTTPVLTPKRRRRSSSVVSGSEDEAGTPVRSSKRLQEKAHTIINR